MKQLVKYFIVGLLGGLIVVAAVIPYLAHGLSPAVYYPWLINQHLHSQQDTRQLNFFVVDGNTRLPVLCYHDILEDRYADQGGVTQSDLRQQWSTLQDLGYHFIDQTQLLNALDGKEELPEKPVMITFDDSLKSVYTLAFPLLKEMDIPAVVNIIGYRVEYDYNYETNLLNWDEAAEMADSGLVTLASQTWNCADPLINMKGDRIYPLVDHKDNESDQSYTKRINDDLAKNNQKIHEYTGQTPLALTWPYGLSNDASLAAMDACGLRLAFDGPQNRANDLSKGFDARHIQRYAIDSHMAVKDFVILINQDT
jgi:peptidoglycan/xylan/chitin deacetylase (PgdA/CDA1 family)